MVTEVKKEKKRTGIKILVSSVIALGMTSLIYSLRADARDGWDFAPADIFLLALLPFCRTMPPKPIWTLALIPVLSTLLADNAPLTYYLSVRFGLTLLIISSLRHYIIAPPFIIFGILSIFISILQIIVFQSRPPGLEGNANLMGGHGLILSYFSLPIGVAMVLLSNSRGAFLALLPLLLHPATQLAIPTFHFPVLSSSTSTPNSQLKPVPVQTLLPSFKLKFSPLTSIVSSQLKLKLLLLLLLLSLLPITLFFFHGKEGLIIGERGRMLSEATERIKQVPYGRGWGWEAKREEVPSFYLSSVQDLGVVLGVGFIGVLVFSLYRSPYGLAILVTGLFDHYFLRSSIGYYSLALALTFPSSISSLLLPKKEQQYALQ